jgi:glycine/D-amino acid oxidase-like deaminating enzyme
VYIPAAADLHFARCFPALRPHTPGGFPARGRVKGAPGLVIRGGREGGGIAPAPIPAKRAAEDTACGKTGLPIGPCPVEGFYNERRV